MTCSAIILPPGPWGLQVSSFWTWRPMIWDKSEMLIWNDPFVSWCDEWYWLRTCACKWDYYQRERTDGWRETEKRKSWNKVERGRVQESWELLYVIEVSLSKWFISTESRSAGRMEWWSTLISSLHTNHCAPQAPVHDPATTNNHIIASAVAMATYRRCVSCDPAEIRTGDSIVKCEHWNRTISVTNRSYLIIFFRYV